jgi:hypothetical protein
MNSAKIPPPKNFGKLLRTILRNGFIDTTKIDVFRKTAKHSAENRAVKPQKGIDSTTEPKKISY